MQRHFWLIVIALICSPSCMAQVDTAVGYASFTYANDVFTATDRYYTQGVGLRVGWNGLKRSLLTRALLRSRDSDAIQYGVLLQQDCFTPSTIRSDTVRRNDRPFAAALYLGLEAVSTNNEKGTRLTSSIILGVLGPCAYCAEEQRWIHNGLDNIEPLGWEFQVERDVVLNYQAQFEKRLKAIGIMEMRGAVNAALGTYRDELGASFTMNIGRGPSVFQAQTQRPLKPQFKAFGTADARMVAYDASMQGGLFQNDDPHTLSAAEIERLIVGYGWGAQLSYRGIDLRYNERYIGRTFSEGLRHGWGTLEVRVWW